MTHLKWRDRLREELIALREHREHDGARGAALQVVEPPAEDVGVVSVLPPEALRGTQRCHQRYSEALRGTQGHSGALSGHQKRASITNHRGARRRHRQDVERPRHNVRLLRGGIGDLSTQIPHRQGDVASVGSGLPAGAAAAVAGAIVTAMAAAITADCVAAGAFASTTAAAHAVTAAPAPALGAELGADLLAFRGRTVSGAFRARLSSTGAVSGAPKGDTQRERRDVELDHARIDVTKLIRGNQVRSKAIKGDRTWIVRASTCVGFGVPKKRPRCKLVLPAIPSPSSTSRADQEIVAPARSSSSK